MARTTEKRVATPAPAGGGKAIDTPLDADLLRRLLQSGVAWLERQAPAVDALNVFPVPDGDTGTNMLLTMRAAVDAANKAKGAGVGQVMKAAAQGALLGARGNSGVILSQILAGLARGVGEHQTCDGALLATALADGAATAYRAVTRPVEGTILTVARAAGDRATAVVAETKTDGPPSPRQVLSSATTAAQEAVKHTPEQLPVLRQAGVVDAGGEGYRIILEGMSLALSGEALPETPSTPATCQDGSRRLPVEHSLAGSRRLPEEGEEWGYCTQFVIDGQGLHVAKLRRELQDLTESALVVGDDSLVRVHGHTHDPGQLLSHAVQYGRLQRISIEDMDAQHDAWLRSQMEEGPRAPVEERPGDSAAADGSRMGRPVEVVEAKEGGPASTVATVATVTTVATAIAGVATVAVAPGPGLAEVFRSLGAGEVVPGGQTMNPSAKELLQAAQRTGAGTVFVLPNNGNVVMTAQQAATLAEGSECRLVIVPTRTVPQGVAAQLAFDPETSLEANADSMAKAAAGVRTVEVTRATRSVPIGGVEVRAGDVLALLEDEVVAAAGDPIAAARQALDRAGAAAADLITIYRGQAPTDADTKTFVAALRASYPDAEIELVAGGQPHYDYLISVE